jgi:hypothetical protein
VKQQDPRGIKETSRFYRKDVHYYKDMCVNWQSLYQCILRSNKLKVGDRSCARDWSCTFGAHTLEDDEELRWGMESWSRIYEFNPGGRWHDEVVAKSSFEDEILAWSNSWGLTASLVPKLLLRDMTLQCVYEWIHAGDRELYTYIFGFVVVMVVVVVAGEGGEGGSWRESTAAKI